MTAAPSRKDEPPRSFADTLADIGHGDTLAHITREFHDMISAGQDFALVMNADAKCEISIKLVVKLSPNGEARIAPDVKTKVPKIKPHPGTMFVNRSGNLVTENQRQPDLPFGSVPKRGEPRDVSNNRAPREATRPDE